MTEKLPISASEEAIDFPAVVSSDQAGLAASLILKRALDLLVSGAALLILSPLFAIIAVLIRLDSEGPVFYRSVRVGKKGRNFNFYKFRTMVINAHRLKSDLLHLNERDGPLFKMAADPRITAVGRWLRRFSLDELPQLWSVFVGDMSLVGPRPPDIEEIHHYRPEDMRTLDVTPGVTGLWQITARLNPSFEVKMALDLEYIEKWSLLLDSKILLKTIPVVFKGDGQ